MLINKNAVITGIQIIINYDPLSSKHGYNRVQPFHCHLKKNILNVSYLKKQTKKRVIQFDKSESFSFNWSSLVVDRMSEEKRQVGENLN